MGKYYVQSGTLRSVVQADSGRRAALWAVHQAMQQVLPIEDDLQGETPTGKSERVSGSGVAVLAAKVCVSEKGFGRADAMSLATMDVVTEWNQLVTTLDRLERMLYRAA